MKHKAVLEWKNNMSETIIPIQIEKQHVIANIDGAKYLIDTGSPNTFVRHTTWWDGEQIPVADSNGVNLLKTISNSSILGIDLDGLIGNDWLLSRCMPSERKCKKSWSGGKLNTKRFLESQRTGKPMPCYDRLSKRRGLPYPRNLTLNIPEGTLMYGSEITAIGETMPMECNSGVPIVTLEAMNTQAKFVVDTGAMQTFISEDLAKGLPRVGTIVDFHPALGNFEADLVEHQITIGDTTHIIKPAIIPVEFESQLKAMPVSGIIGLDVLQHVPFSFSPEKKVLSPAVRY